LLVCAFPPSPHRADTLTPRFNDVRTYAPNRR
jgi:hypothetical protein